ncbi:MAG: hypothetical protein KDC85_07880 [Saprospiraceae bacterium]|nr:hypothetical protein [Saprospiraceae bacterium]MCB9323420.1 hypothetical protein [Lewinellaceae bacterium]
MKNLFSNQAKRFLVYFLSALLLFQTTSCRYFSVGYANAPTDIPTIFEIGKVYKKFIVHSDNNEVFITDIELDSIALSGTIQNIDKPVYYDEFRSSRYKKFEKDIVHEVHIYLRNYTILLPGQTQIPVEDIKEIRIIEQNTGKTVASYVLGTLGILAGTYVLLIIIILLTKSSCPYVYVNDGESFVFEGETFGGAILQNLERDDYMPLPSIRAVDGTYRLRITNELKEKQYTDVASLMVINHQKSEKVLLDKYGQPYLITAEQPPENVYSLSGTDVKNTLSSRDRDVFLFNETDFDENAVVMKFERPGNVQTGKLVFTAKNSLWLDYLYGCFNEKFGSRYNPWVDKHKKDSHEERLQKVVENGFPLSVYLKTDAGWKLVDYLHTVGPLADREFVVPVDLSAVTGKEIELKLSTGFMYWELDHVAMDFTENEALNMTEIKPLMAVNNDGEIVTDLLAENDRIYLEQTSVGEVAEVRFLEVPIPEGMSQTVFLHSRGYYELIRDYEGFPQITELNKFKKAGYFMQFSREEYLKFLQKEEPSLASDNPANNN